MIDHYDRILCQVKDALPDVKLYLMAYYPINYDAATEEMKPCLLVRTNQKIAEANAAVEKLAEKHHAKYIDINDPLKDENGNLNAYKRRRIPRNFPGIYPVCRGIIFVKKRSVCGMLETEMNYNKEKKHICVIEQLTKED